MSDEEIDKLIHASRGVRNHLGHVTFAIDDLRYLVRSAVNDERVACAEVADSAIVAPVFGDMAARKIAAAIRKRGEE